MEKVKAELKAELLEACSEALDEMLENCEADMDFAEIERQVECFSQKVLAKTLARSSERLALFAPSVSQVSS